MDFRLDNKWIIVLIFLYSTNEFLMGINDIKITVETENYPMFDRQSIHIALLLWGSIFSLIAALCMFMSRNFDREKRRWMLFMLLTCTVLLCSDALAWAFRGGAGMSGYLMVRISNFLVFVMSDTMLFFFHGYTCCYLFAGKDAGEKPPTWRIKAGYLIAVIGVLLVVISQFTNLYYYFDAKNFYHRSPAYIISLIVPMAGMLLDLTLIVQYRENVSREIFVALISYIALPFMGAVALAFYYGISLINIAISISMILMFVTAMEEQNQNLAKKESEATELRISLMMSQISPHFLYNSLNSIYHLCDKNIELAKQAISDFSEYLRHILGSVNRTTPIEFEEELKYVKNYLSLEQMRFDEDLNVLYHIEATNFCVPALSVQPLVENAVKHGICRKEDGGTLILFTKEYEEYFEIVVSDDGVGFDPEKRPEDGKLHVGIENVKQRLEAMCGGTLTIESRPGEGTRVTIRLPKEKKNENTRRR